MYSNLECRLIALYVSSNSTGYGLNILYIPCFTYLEFFSSIWVRFSLGCLTDRIDFSLKDSTLKDFMDFLGRTSKATQQEKSCGVWMPLPLSGRRLAATTAHTLFYLLNRLEVTALAERMECPWCCLTTKFLSEEVEMWLALIEFHLFQIYWTLDIIKSAALLCLGENKTWAWRLPLSRLCSSLQALSFVICWSG